MADGELRSGLGLAQQVFELGEDLLDGIEVGRVFRQEEELSSGVADGLANVGALVALQVVDQDHVARLQCRRENLLDVNQKAIGIHRLVEEPRRFDAVVPQGGDKGHGVPMSVGNLRPEPFTARRPSA